LRRRRAGGEFGLNNGVQWTCAGIFFLHLFLAPGGGGSCAAARRSHEGSGLEVEVLGGGFGWRTTPCWMGAELNGGEGDDSNRD